MTTVKFSGKIESAYGKTISPALSYDAEYESYDTPAEVRAANDMLTDEEQKDFRNNQRRANSRQKAMQQALDDAKIVKPDVKTDPQLRLKRMYELFIANGSDHDEARASAAQALNLTWDSE